MSRGFLARGRFTADKFERSLSTTTKVVVGIQWATTTMVVVGIKWVKTRHFTKTNNALVSLGNYFPHVFVFGVIVA